MSRSRKSMRWGDLNPEWDEKPKPKNKPKPENKSVLSRRKLIWGAAASIIGGTAITFLNSREKTEAEKFLESVPDQIPGAAVNGVKKYPVEGAERCLVHLRHTHHINFLVENRLVPFINQMDPTMQIVMLRLLRGDSLEQMDYPWLGASKKKFLQEQIDSENLGRFIQQNLDLISRFDQDQDENIAAIVEYFAKEKHVSHIHLEDVDEVQSERLNAYHETRDSYDQQLKKIQFLLLNDKSLGKEMIEKLIHEMHTIAAHTELLDEKVQDRLLSLFPLFKNNIIRVQPTYSSTSTVFQETLELVQQESSTGEIILDSENNEKREDHFLQIASKRTRSVVLVRFGAAHQWFNNIEKWNEEHPEHKFSLIEITPEGYEEVK